VVRFVVPQRLSIDQRFGLLVVSPQVYSEGALPAVCFEGVTVPAEGGVAISPVQGRFVPDAQGLVAFDLVPVRAVTLIRLE
jgi:hypothetical protein